MSNAGPLKGRDLSKWPSPRGEASHRRAGPRSCLACFEAASLKSSGRRQINENLFGLTPHSLGTAAIKSRSSEQGSFKSDPGQRRGKGINCNRLLTGLGASSYLTHSIIECLGAFYFHSQSGLILGRQHLDLLLCFVY